MSKNNLLLLLLGGLAVGGFAWAINERTKRKQQEEDFIKDYNDLHKAYLDLLTEYFNKENSFPEEITNQIINLRNNYSGINDAIAFRLHQIVELITENKEEIAIEKLAMVIENMLADKLIKEGHIKKKSTFSNMLNKAFDLNWLTKREHSCALVLKDERNVEAHELIANMGANWKSICFLSGIELIYKFEGYSY